MKEFDEAIAQLEEDIDTLKGKVEDLNVSLKTVEEELAGKKKGYDDLLAEKDEIEADIQKTMDCPKCGDSVELPLDAEKTLHLLCDSCGAKGRLPNPNKDVMLDLEDIEEEIKELKGPVDELEAKISEITDKITDSELEIKNKENDLGMRQEEREEYVDEMMKKAPSAPRRKEKAPPKEKYPEKEEDFGDEDEDEEEVEQEDEDAFCPMCYADLTEPPYNRCPGCGWEEEADHSDAPSTYDTYASEEPYDEPYEEPIDDFGRRFEEADYYDPGDRKKAAEEHYQVPCRCGADIDIWTSKRPTKIKCDSCGARGMLKGMGKKVTEDYHGEFKYEAPGTFEDDFPTRESPEKSTFCGSCGARNVNTKFCSECGEPLGPKKRKPPAEKRGRKRRPPKERGRKRPEGRKKPEGREGREARKEDRKGGRKRGGGRPRKRDGESKEKLQEQALNILVKLEKLLDRAADKDLYFPEVEDEMDGLESEIEGAASVDELKRTIDKAKKLGNKVNRELKK